MVPPLIEPGGRDEEDILPVCYPYSPAASRMFLRVRLWGQALGQYWRQHIELQDDCLSP